jgi:hypothetical protein
MKIKTYYDDQTIYLFVAVKNYLGQFMSANYHPNNFDRIRAGEGWLKANRIDPENYVSHYADEFQAFISNRIQ